MPEYFFSGTLLVRLRESTVTMTTWVSSVRLSMEQIPAVSGQAALVSSCHRYVKAYTYTHLMFHPSMNSLHHRPQPNPRSDPPLLPPQHPLPQLPPQQGHPCQGGKTTDELFLGVDPGPRPRSAGPSLMRKLPLIWRPPKGSRTLGPRHRLKGGTPTTTQGKTNL